MCVSRFTNSELNTDDFLLILKLEVSKEYEPRPLAVVICASLVVVLILFLTHIVYLDYVFIAEMDEALKVGHGTTHSSYGAHNS